MTDLLQVIFYKTLMNLVKKCWFTVTVCKNLLGRLSQIQGYKKYLILIETVMYDVKNTRTVSCFINIIKHILTAQKSTLTAFFFFGFLHDLINLYNILCLNLIKMKSM